MVSQAQYSHDADDEAFSLHTAHHRFGTCTAQHGLPFHRIPHPGQPYHRFVWWHTTSSLGNALNGFVMGLLYAVITGRMLLWDQGDLVPRLLCGAHGAYHCGIPELRDVKVVLGAANGGHKVAVRQSTVGRASFEDGAVFFQPEAGRHQMFHGDARHITTPTLSTTPTHQPQGTRGLHEQAATAIDVVATDIKWFQYRGVDVSRFTKHKSNATHTGIMRTCLFEALGCTAGTLLEPEACIMARAMQLLLPNGTLQSPFIQGAMETARLEYTGKLDELRRVLIGDQHDARVRTANSSSWRVLVAPHAPLMGRGCTATDASTRFAGAFHIRSLSPRLEHHGASTRDSLSGKFRDYHEFEEHMTRNAELWKCLAMGLAELMKANHLSPAASIGPSLVMGMGANGYSNSTDSNTDRHALAAPLSPRGEKRWTLFVASDMDGLCDQLEELTHTDEGALHPDVSIACFSTTPVHLTKSKTTPNEDERSGVGLTSQLTTVLDWVLLSRSNLLAGVTRQGKACHLGGVHKTHEVHLPGRSFFGWALAQSNLPPSDRLETKFHPSCPCNLEARSVSAIGREVIKGNEGGQQRGGTRNRR